MNQQYLKSMFVNYSNESEQYKFVIEWLETQDAKDLERILKSFVSGFKEAWEKQPIPCLDMNDEAGEKCEEICLELMDCRPEESKKEQIITDENRNEYATHN